MLHENFRNEWMEGCAASMAALLDVWLAKKFWMV